MKEKTKRYPCRYVTQCDLLDWGISPSVVRELVRGLEYRHPPNGRLRLYSTAEVEGRLRKKLENPRIASRTRAAIELALDDDAFRERRRANSPADENLEGRLERIEDCRSGDG